MPHITTCTHCGKAYEESSEETANAPGERLCSECFQSEKAFTKSWRMPALTLTQATGTTGTAAGAL